MSTTPILSSTDENGPTLLSVDPSPIRSVNKIQSPAPSPATNKCSILRPGIMSPIAVNQQLQPSAITRSHHRLCSLPSIGSIVRPSPSPLPPPRFARVEIEEVTAQSIPPTPSLLDFSDHLNQSLVGRDELTALQCQVDMLKQQLIAFELFDQQNQRALTLKSKEQEALQQQIQRMKLEKEDKEEETQKKEEEFKEQIGTERRHYTHRSGSGNRGGV